jgi:serralysin
VNLYAVQKAIKTGRITTRKDGKIDTELADREWEQNTVARPTMVTKKAPARQAPAKQTPAKQAPTASSANTADVHMWKLTNNQIGPGVLGQSEVPNYSSGFPLYYDLNGQATEWENGKNKGGYGYMVALHELGHLLGLAHPHDGGTAPDGTTFPGVFDSYDLGKHNLNQGIFTIMSYNAGWQSKYPNHDFVDYGWQATPMALDIAAIQAIYGANMNAATGDNAYALSGSNGKGTYWECIWDAGGVDKINYGGSKDCRIDLREAPLVGPNAGGYVSYVKGIVGGFTIANGVTIEKAIGGKGDDVIKGNSADNVLSGRGGADKIRGYDGDDRLKGGGGTDKLYGGAGNDKLFMSAGNDVIKGGADTDTLIATGNQGVRINLSKTGAQKTGIGTQTFVDIENLTGTRKGDRLKGDAQANDLQGQKGHDKLYGAAGNDVIRGGAGNDTIFGGTGDDTLEGGSGLDQLWGKEDADTFVFASASDSGMGSARDVIHDFVSGTDKIDLSQIDDDFVFSGTAAAANGVWYALNGSDAIVYMDVDGDGVADSEISLLGVSSLSATDFLL